MKRCLAPILLLALISCNTNAEQVKDDKSIESSVEIAVSINPAGRTISERFPEPTGFTRVKAQENSFAAYLQNFKLKPHGAVVHYYNGKVKPNDDVYEAVLDIDVGNYDLQQCADAVMRLRAEYLFKQKRFSDIHFNFTNGFKADYSKWQQGYRVNVNGNTTNWVKKVAPSTAYTSFRDYLKLVFTYAGTKSLEKEMKAIAIKDIKIGDVFIKGGSPGHAVIVVDMAVNVQTNEKLFLLAQSYMPAQEIQILKNPMSPNLSPWYSTNFTGPLFTPEWTFQKSQLKRF
ncbi:DUF4846 domain-containing protein [Pontibacter sp. KCTC 32443]|uniref:DUF4846 domain-containing protein n=1 Tax=Pontibacter TaxID=323449 RepID=UPI00164DC9E2|nr:MULTISPECIES: DUF4846 domain-containing protein [Pontibacter]MBC5775113.1 DUF4846 domain-containing protein [Pontibacter sp. KCTC 32443]